MKALVLAEYYPRAGDPVRGIWAHRQTLATRAAGADVRVLVLHRPLPPLASLRGGDRSSARIELSQPGAAVLDGIRVGYVRYLSPPRPWSYEAWGAWAAPSLALALARVRREFPYDLIHAHYAVPAGDAVRRVAARTPLVLSVHGHDVYGSGSPSRTVGRALAHARLTLANSTETARRCAAGGAHRIRIVHLGTDPPPPTHRPGGPGGEPVLVTVAHLAARKHHGDVLEAVSLLRGRFPALRYVIVGDGPERERLHARAAELGIADRIRFCGQVAHEEAMRLSRSGSLFVLPSVDEAFGVAYVEAMAGGVPAVGCRGEGGPEEIAAAGGGMVLVPAHEPRILADTLAGLLEDRLRLTRLGEQARATVQREFTWEACGRATVAAYEEALA
ncbi:MAG: glycosyltransferase [Solirubrobacteraceae bacterium]